MSQKKKSRHYDPQSTTKKSKFDIFNGNVNRTHFVGLRFDFRGWPEKGGIYTVSFTQIRRIVSIPLVWKRSGFIFFQKSLDKGHGLRYYTDG